MPRETTVPILELRLFGGFLMEDAAGRPVDVTLRKAQALIAFLAMAPGQRATREQLAVLLWGDSVQQRARQSLRQVLLTLSRGLAACGAPVLDIDSQRISLVPGRVRVDAGEFEALLADGSRAALERAVALYSGDLLAGASLDAPEFDDWLARSRERLRDLCLKGLVSLIGHLEAAGDSGPAITAAKRLLEIDPFREDIHRWLMRAYVRSGTRSLALDQYRRCRALLERELGVAPDRETVCLYEEILGASGSPNSGGPSPVADPLPERAALLTAHYQALAGSAHYTGPSTQWLAAVLAGARAEVERGSPASARALLALADSMARDLAVETAEAIDRLLVAAALAEAEGRLEDAVSALAQAETRAGDRMPPGSRLEILTARSRGLYRAVDAEAAYEVLRTGLALAETTGIATPWSPVAVLIEHLDRFGGRLTAVAARLERRGRKADSLGLDAEGIEYAALLGLLRAAQGEGQPAAAAVDGAVARAERAGTDACLATALEAQGLAQLWNGAPGAALSGLERAAGIAERRGDLLRLYLLGGLRGAALLAADRTVEARRALGQALGTAGRLGTAFLVPLFAAWLAEAEVATGAGSAERCRDTLRRAVAANRPWAASLAGRALARSRAQAGEHEAARSAVYWAIDIQTGLGLACELDQSRKILRQNPGSEGRAA